MNNLICYYCCHPAINSKMYKMPTQYDEEKRTYCFYGQFCSWECMKSYNLYSKSSYKQQMFNLIQKFHDEIQGNSIIKFAPPKELLYCFGGQMSIEDFRKNNEIFTVYEFPTKNEERIIERYENFSVPQEVINENNTSIQNEPIRLKRKTPKVSSQHTLETSMGIFKT